ncbi:MAG: GNAT family N-acetyltransferase [Dongiaceae bacterium]
MSRSDAPAGTILETERLRLRRLEPGDLEALHALYSDPEIRRYFPEGVLTRAQTKEELDWFVAGDPDHPALGLWATVLKPDGEFIGRCGLLPCIVEGRPEVEVAYLIDKCHWRQGFGAEAAAALVRYGFDTLGLTRIVAFVDPANAASAATARKAGLAFEREIAPEGMRTAIYAIERRRDADETDSSA